MRPLLAAIPFAGTLINAGAILVGTATGLAVGHRLSERIRVTVMDVLGLLTLALGMDGALAAFREPLSSFSRASVLFVMGSVLVGGVIGELARLEDRLAGFGEALKRRIGSGEARFVEGFVVASLVFCVGPMAVLGSIQDGLSGDFELLAIKSLLDGFAALAFASALGVGVGSSIITVIAYQGSLTLVASSVSNVFTDEMIAALTAAGGLLILGISLRLLDLKQVRVGNMLPALVIAPLSVWAWQTLL
jgi:uncharacterized membrane protein YqgA involved in biofilm formation